jgi:hypothetical protein
MREIRLSSSEGGGIESNRLSLPLSKVPPAQVFLKQRRGRAAYHEDGGYLCSNRA